MDEIYNLGIYYGNITGVDKEKSKAKMKAAMGRRLENPKILENYFT
jgi:hypothetical protein